MSTLDLELVARDLRRVVQRLAGVDLDPDRPDRDRADFERVSHSLVLSLRSPAETRADTWLAVIQELVAMRPGDVLTVQWHDPGRGDGRVATLDLKRGDAL